MRPEENIPLWAHERPPAQFVRLFVAATLVWAVIIAGSRVAWAGNISGLKGFRTDTRLRSIDLSELQPAGPGKDGVPSLERPRFVGADSAAAWLAGREPVICLVVNDDVRAYPLQIMIWHQIVNDYVGHKPVAITFCPLTYCAAAFERRFKGYTHDFGVSGFLRKSNLVMYDRQSETLWQQLTGRAIVGALLDTRLRRIPTQIISFSQFRKAYPKGVVLSRRTGFDKRYGTNPYVGYDNVNSKPFMFTGRLDNRLAPMEKMVGISLLGQSRGYPYSTMEPTGVINDTINTNHGLWYIVVFHTDGAVTALQSPVIAKSRQVGSTGLFSRSLAGRVLDFYCAQGTIYDVQTSSTWDITGKALTGPCAGKRLDPLPHSDCFSFAWLAFRPQTTIIR